jgi:N-dimethylarginine dimethylaminohydrolase
LAYWLTHYDAAAMCADTAWGVDSEYGRLLDVLLCPPDHFRWLPTSAISRATLDSGLVFSREDALRQHAEMVSVYEENGVTVHFLEPEPTLPYQVFARDSSVNVPGGPIVTQCAQWWRRGEYAPVIRFYQGQGIPIGNMITAGSLEGGDFMIVEPGVAAIGTGEERTQEQAARQLAGWLEQEGWEVRVERIPPHFLHIDVLACMLGEKLAAVCVEQASTGFVRWLESKNVEIVPVTLAAALKLGVNGVCLGGDRVLSTAESKDLNDRLRALGLSVYDPELSAFTLGGGGAHCLMQAIRRERVA